MKFDGLHIDKLFIEQYFHILSRPTDIFIKITSRND